MKSEIDMSKFNELIAADKPVLVDFFAEWCGPCKSMKPILEELKQKMGDGVTILKIDVDKNRQLALRYGIQSVPTLMIFKEGRQLWRQSGVVNAAALKDVLDNYKQS